MKSIIKSVIVLTLVVLFSILILFYVWKTAYPYIIRQETDRQKKAVEEVLPEYTVSEEITVTLDDGEKFSYWAGTKTVDDLEKKAFAFTSVNYGYNVDIKAIVGVDEENRILGIRIFQQTETPGPDARLTDSIRRESDWGAIQGRNFSREVVTESWFQEQFRGIDLGRKIMILSRGLYQQNFKDGVLYQNSITAVTGATVSTKIIIDSLKENLVKLLKARSIHEQDLLTQQNLMLEQNKEEDK